LAELGWGHKLEPDGTFGGSAVDNRPKSIDIEETLRLANSLQSSGTIGQYAINGRDRRSGRRVNKPGLEAKWRKFQQRYLDLTVKMDSRIDVLNAKMDFRIEGLSGRIDTLIGKVIELTDRVSPLETQMGK
jgi:hypothetical protein